MALTPTRPMSIEKVRNLMKGSQTDLNDAHVASISVGRRFDAAYDAGFRCALALLEANRVQSEGQGHHRETLDFMVTTLGLKCDTAELIPLVTRARNANRYDAIASITESMVEATIKWAQRVQAETIAWFEKHNPQALKS